MKVRFIVAVEPKTKGKRLSGSLGCATREEELPFQPTEQMWFVTPCWEHPRRLQEVAYDLGKGRFLAYFRADLVESEENCRSLIETYRKHGWEIVNSEEGSDQEMLKRGRRPRIIAGGLS